MTLSRGALCLFFLAVTLPTGVGCRSGGMSGMKTWWPGQLVEKDEAAAADLAAAPAFGGDIAKPSSKATPYPTTSTPEGYVVPGAEGSAQLAQSQPAAGGNEATAASPPVTYGMQPPAIAADLPSDDLPAAGAPQPSMEAIAEQVGPYQPLAGSSAPAGNPSAAPGAFAAAGGMAPGAFPPEQPLGAAPPAGSVPQGLPAPGDPAGLGSAPSAAYATAAPSATPPQPSSAYSSMPPAASGSAFAATPSPTSPPTAGGSAFGQTAEPRAAASSFAPPASSYASAGVPQGGAGDSPVAGSRFASAAPSGFPTEPLTPPAVAAGSETAAASAAPWQTASAATAASAASAASFGSPASDGMASRFGQPPSQDPLVEPTGSTAPATPSNDGQPATRPGRRPDPMYRPAGTSSYRPAQPIFADDPEPVGPVRMATYEEPVVDRSRQ